MAQTLDLKDLSSIAGGTGPSAGRFKVTLIPYVRTMIGKLQVFGPYETLDIAKIEGKKEALALLSNTATSYTSVNFVVYELDSVGGRSYQVYSEIVQ